MATPPPPPGGRDDDIKRYRASYRDEVDGVALYEALSDAADKPEMRELFAELAASEARHRDLWVEKLREAGATVPHLKPSWRVKAIGFLARRFGIGAVAPIVSSMEAMAMTMYDDQPDAVLAGLPASERSHARVFREIAKTGYRDEAARSIPQLEGRHRAGSGNALRAAVLGVNDGLVSTLSLVMGVAGADPGREVVLLGGIAGLLAGSFSMALGEWISVRSSAEAFERQLNIERLELEMNPEEEEAELALIYQVKGLSAADAKATAKRIISNKDTALDTLAREELGMSSEEAGNAWVAASTSFLLFAVGALLPVLPWFFVGGLTGVVLSAIMAGLGLFAAGTATTLFTGRSVLFSGGRMLVFGAVVAAITFAIGKLVGVSTGV